MSDILEVPYRGRSEVLYSPTPLYWGSPETQFTTGVEDLVDDSLPDSQYLDGPVLELERTPDVSLFQDPRVSLTDGKELVDDTRP